MGFHINSEHLSIVVNSKGVNVHRAVQCRILFLPPLFVKHTQAEYHSMEELQLHLLWEVPSSCPFPSAGSVSFVRCRRRMDGIVPSVDRVTAAPSAGPALPSAFHRTVRVHVHRARVPALRASPTL